MKTQASRTISNGLHILKLIEIACKSHMILSTSEKEETGKYETPRADLQYLHRSYRSCLKRGAGGKGVIFLQQIDHHL